MDFEVMDETQAARILGDLSPRTLQRWRWAGIGPQYLKVGRFVRYTRADLVAWLESRRRSSTSDTGAAA
jgi:hypothetical protein